MLFTLIIFILLLFSVGSVFAGDNETVSDVVGVSKNLDDLTTINELQEVQTAQSDEQILQANDNELMSSM